MFQIPSKSGLYAARLLGAAAVAAIISAVPAFAQNPPPPNPAQSKVETVVVTGSRIPQRVDPASGLPQTISPVRIYSREQLDGTGRQYDLRAALGALDPSLTH